MEQCSQLLCFLHRNDISSTVLGRRTARAEVAELPMPVAALRRRKIGLKFKNRPVIRTGSSTGFHGLEHVLHFEVAMLDWRPWAKWEDLPGQKTE